MFCQERENTVFSLILDIILEDCFCNSYTINLFLDNQSDSCQLGLSLKKESCLILK